MDVTVFGAAGPTGNWLCHGRCEQVIGCEPSAAGPIRCRSHRCSPDPSTRRRGQRCGVLDAVDGADAVLSALGAAYTRHPVSVYSTGTQAIVDALRSDGRGNRLVVVSSGLTSAAAARLWRDPGPHRLSDLRNVVGAHSVRGHATRMEEILRAPTTSRGRSCAQAVVRQSVGLQLPSGHRSSVAGAHGSRRSGSSNGRRTRRNDRARSSSSSANHG